MPTLSVFLRVHILYITYLVFRLNLHHCKYPNAIDYSELFPPKIPNPLQDILDIPLHSISLRDDKARAHSHSLNPCPLSDQIPSLNDNLLLIESILHHYLYYLFLSRCYFKF